MFELYLQAKRLRYLARRGWRKLSGASRRSNSFQPYAISAIPRKLWLYWGQGFEQAPDLVKRCVQTWQENNPGWAMELLDETNLTQFVTMPPLPDSIAPAHRADVLRTRLLAQHGGVWADATTWCLRPLDEWLPMAAQAGFFVFTWPKEDLPLIASGPRRILGNWFIAAAPDNPLIEAWDGQTLAYWRGRPKTDQYFWHNDAAEYVLRQSGEPEVVWNRMPKFSAATPHVVWNALENGASKEDAKAVLASGAVPLLKLSWRMHATVSEIEQLVSGAGARSGARGGG